MRVSRKHQKTLSPPVLESMSKEHCTLLKNLGHYVYYHRLPSLAQNAEDDHCALLLPPSSALLEEPFPSHGIFEITLMEQSLFIEPANIPSVLDGVSLFAAPSSMRPFVVEYLCNRFSIMEGRDHLWALKKLHPRRGQLSTLKNALGSNATRWGGMSDSYLPLPLRFLMKDFSCDMLLHVLPSFPFESLAHALQLEPMGEDFHCDFEVPLSLCFGSTVLPLEDVRTLERGDILLIETATSIRAG